MNSDLALQLVLRMDNSTIKLLSCTPLWQSISPIVSTEYFWYRRTEYLVNSRLAQRAGRDWKTTYYTLEKCLLEYGRLKFRENLLEDPLAVEVLLELGIDPSSIGSYALRHAAEKGYTEVVHLLLQDGRADPAASDSEALSLASQYGHIEVVLALLQDGRADPSVDDSEALRYASMDGHIEVVHLLLRDGRADPTAGDSLALRYAAVNRHIEVVLALLRDGRADPTSENNTALRYASTEGHIEVVLALLEDGRADPTMTMH